MFKELSQFLDITGYIPHGYCLNWSMPLIITNVGSDLLISASYFSMPVALVYFSRRRRDFPYQWLLWMFAAFILACGATHLLGAVVLWLPLYGLDALLKLVTAIVSLTTALMLWPMIPHALKLPSPSQLRRTNDELRAEITKREQVEEALIKAKALVEDSLSRERAQIAAIVENAEVAIFGVSPDGIVTSWNRAAEIIFGYAAGTIVGRSGLVLVPAEYQSQERQVLAAIASGGSGEQFDSQRIREDGTRLDVSIIISPIRNRDGEILGASIIARDISEIKAFQTSLAFQARRAEALLELPRSSEVLDEVSFIQRGLEMAEDLTGSRVSFVHFVNETEDSLELVAWSKRTLSGYCNAAFDRHYPAGRAGIWADALRQKQPVIFNDYAGYPDKQGLPEGHAELLRLISLPVIEDGKVVMLVGVGNKPADYTHEDVNSVQLFANVVWRVVQRQRSNRKIERERLRLETILKTASDGIHILDGDGVLVEANDAFFTMLGYDRSDYGRLRVTDWNAVDPPDTVRARIANLMEKNEKLRFETRHRRRDGGILDVEISAAAVEFEGRKYLYAASRDITDRKRAEAELRRSELKYRTLFDSSGDAVMLLTEQGFVDCNASALEVFGCATRAEFCTKHPGDLSPPQQSCGSDSYSLANQRVKTAINEGSVSFEWLHRRADSGQVFLADVLLTAMRFNEDTIVQAVVRDITQRKEAEERINELAFYDPLTHLPNRRLLMDRLSQAIAGSVRNEREGALLFVDLDHFKKVNDTHGHDQGDLLLQEVAQRLTASFRGADTVARIGGDEFVVVLADLSGNAEDAAAQAEIAARKILAILGEPYRIAGNVFRSTPSIGITLFGDQRGDIDELMKQADIAMYQAKGAGRNALRFFDPELQAANKARASLEADLHQGIQQGQILVHYQPQVDGEGRLMGAEALVRWLHPQRGLVSPGEFIPLAEESGLILAIGNCVLETGCNQIVAWADRRETAHITVAVNVSARQFRQTDFVEQVLDVVTRTGANPQRLKLELTESMLVDDVPETIAKMMALKSRGISFSLDDFGTGYSSLAYLKRLPLDQLKIDQSFVRDVLKDPNDEAIARTIVSLGQTLGLGVIAEGVETVEQRDFLAKSGCHAYQGYFFSRPLPLAAFEEFARQASSQKDNP